MGVLNEGELSSLRTELNSVWTETMPDTCSQYRGETKTRDALAKDEFTAVPDEIETGIPCRYRSSNGHERIIAGKSKGSNLITLKIPADRNVEEGDVFVVDEKSGNAEIKMEVLTPLRKSNALLLSVICET